MALAARSLIPQILFDAAEGFESVGGEVDGVALDFSGFQDVFAEGAEVALDGLAVAAVVFEAAAPEAGVVLDAVADLAAD